MKSDPVRYRLDKWQRQLIDLSSRNRLLNFKPTRVTTVRVVDELPTEVFRSLYLESRSMRFLPLQEPQLEAATTEFHPVDRTRLPGQQTDALLQTILPADKLDNSLLRIYQNSTSLFEEQGVNALFLALGMIEWYESRDAETKLKAPLTLLPIQLTRQTARSGFVVKATQDDPVLNPAIAEKLRLDFRLALPTLPDTFEDFDPQAFFAAVQEAIAVQARWRVTNDINMGLFTFQKFVMYKDMEVNQSHYAEHPVVRALCLGRGERILPLPDYILNANLDEAMPPEATHQVLDADSSQQRALLAVKSKYDLVLEGPPGTGKSQTIANLIADALADGKSVLFVSEKMAALEVVYGRLQTLGLHDFCLNLHSNKANKRAVIEELARVLNSPRARDHHEDAQLAHLAAVREELNGYVSDLHEPFGALATSPFQIFGELAQVDSAPAINAPIDGIAECSRDQFAQTRRDLAEHASLVEEVGDPAGHAWRGSELQLLRGTQRDQLEEAIDRAIASVTTLVQISKNFADQIGATPPSRFGQVELLCGAAQLLAQSPTTSEAILQNARWNTISAEAAELFNHGRRYTELRAQVLQHFKVGLLIPTLIEFTELLQADFTELLDRYTVYCRSWNRFFNYRFWQDRNALRVYFQPDYKPANNQELLRDLNVAHECRAEQLFLRARDDAGRELFGVRWQCEDSDWDELRRFAEWVTGVRQFIIEEALQSKGITLAASGQIDTRDIQPRVNETGDLLTGARRDVLEVARLGAFAPGHLSTDADGKLTAVRERLAELRGAMASLRVWTVYQASLHKCRAGIARRLLEKFYERPFDAVWFELAFRRLFYRRWLDLVCAARPRLDGFRALSHETRIAEFKQLDRRALELARQRALYQLSATRDRLITDPVQSVELIVVQREARKRSRHIPLRQLLSKAPRAMRTIKPCLMMSPLTVAQFLDPAIHQFDLVVFDEASQIPPEDALGAVVRGQQIVVVGDTKQLPPTSFFSAQIIAADDIDPTAEDEPLITDNVESILDEFASVGFPRWRLKWHYRSQHESLITFSNRKFYDNELLTFPGAATTVENGGVQFVWVGGIYEGQGINPIEARAVANAVCEHIRTRPDLSLGVGTFNIKQQFLILDELDRRRREDPALEFFFARKGEDQFFVKNLENIQGDDRDVIYLSITYGPDAEGRVRYNFGPINGPNGWRRLNVILTRAKRSLKIFSSLRGEQIDPTRAQSEGARLLREYLLFAERGILSAPVVDAAAEMESPFEQCVYEALTQCGLRLVPQVGQSGYRIDFGVLDVKTPGRFIAGIECDGAAYHSAATARDRDRLRQEVLEKLGWRIHRIWSTDWYHDRNAQIERILKLVEQSRLEAQREDEARRLALEQAVKESSAVASVATPTGPQATIPAMKDAPPPSDVETREAQAASGSVPLYVLTTVNVIGEAEQFYDAPDTLIADTLFRVVTCEAPIHIIEATRRVAAHWQMNRVGSRIRERVLSAARHLEQQDAIAIAGEFLWNKAQKNVRVRSRALQDYSFDAEHICPAEFEAAAIMILRAHGPRLINELVAEVARVMGYDRAGRKLGEPITVAIESLVNQGCLRAVATGIQIAEDERDETTDGHR
jgi:very-short-patch-repair endonuclease